MTQESLEYIRSHVKLYNGNMKLVGTWYWVTFDGKQPEHVTKPLKDAGFKFASQKKKWVLTPESKPGEKKKARSLRWDYSQIREKYGEKEL